MIKLLVFVVSVIEAVSSQEAQVITEKPCKARSIPGQSVVCVCNSDYCDEIVREEPTSDNYVAYVTSKSGARFEKFKGTMQTSYDKTFSDRVTTLRLNVSKQYQKIEGFGGAITDSAGINWLSFNDTKLRDSLINSYFSPQGTEYNVIRTPIGGCDFSTRKYALNELPKYDKRLTNFSLVYEDYEYKIPMLKAAMEASEQDLHVFSTTWSPPDWMKVSNGISLVCGKLNPEYYQTYADYHLKYIEAYQKEGIDIYAITTTNEPADAYYANVYFFNCMGWSSNDQAKWIVENLGPSIRNSKYNDTMIFVNDDQRFFIPFLFNELVSNNPDVLKYIDGVAVHGYADAVISPQLLGSVTEPYPGLKLMVTEFCEGTSDGQPSVELGSWDRAESYIESIFGNLNYGAVGYIDWNLCLDRVGGPNWALNFVDSPIIVFPDREEFVKQPTFYVMGHFSKFVRRGSKRIGVVVKKAPGNEKLENVAFLTPENTVVVVLYNPSNAATVTIMLGSRAAPIMVPAESLVTVEMLVDATSFEPSAVNTRPDAPDTPDEQTDQDCTSDTVTCNTTTNVESENNPQPIAVPAPETKNEQPPPKIISKPTKTTATTSTKKNENRGCRDPKNQQGGARPPQDRRQPPSKRSCNANYANANARTRQRPK